LLPSPSPNPFGILALLLRSGDLGEPDQVAQFFEQHPDAPP
jgi:hypothetical protein